MDSDSFESYRPLLFSIAYRMLGSAMDAEDIVQEAYMRYQQVPPETIQFPKALLSTIVTRLCLNQLSSAREQRETYIGPWLPEPVLTETVELPQIESISMAFLVILESLSPTERAVFLLREVFDYEYSEIAEIVDKPEPTCRQHFSRAKKHIVEHRPRFKSSPEEHQRIVARFMQAAQQGEVEQLAQLLAEDVTMWSDGGGKVFAALHPVHGRDLVLKFIMGTQKLAPAGFTLETSLINGKQGLILRDSDGTAFLVISFEVDQGLIHTFHVIGNPDKLRHI